MLAIYKKDLKSAFTSMTGWVLCAFIMLIMGIYFTALCLNGGYADFEYVLKSMEFIFLVFVPLLTMRCVEERRQKTDQLLLTSPISIGQMVWGKYLALLTVYALPLLVLCLCPLIISQYGTVSLVRAYACLLAFFLLGAASIAIGLFLSSITESQIIAAVTTFALLLVLYLMTALSSLISSTALASFIGFTFLLVLLAVGLYALLKSVLVPCVLFLAAELSLLAVYLFQSAWLEGALPHMLKSLALFDRFTNFVNGVFDITGLVYMISVALLFVLFTCQSYEKRRWN